MDDDCNCEFDPYDDEPEEESFHYKRTCAGCGAIWWSLHCRHDGAQWPCVECGWRDPSTSTPAELFGFAQPPGA